MEVDDEQQTNGNTVKRLKLDESSLDQMSVEDLLSQWKKQEKYIDHLESQIDALSKIKDDLLSAKEVEEKLKQQQLEANKRENILVLRLTTKEQEVADLLNRIQELREAPSESRLSSTLLDPALNLMFEKMKKEVATSRERVEQMQNELSAWKFTTDSHTGKKLMAKCQSLYKENEELGKAIESGRISKLEGELALQKSFGEELKKSQAETDEFLFELDEEVEGMQATILHLQAKLKENRTENVHKTPEPIETLEVKPNENDS